MGPGNSGSGGAHGKFENSNSGDSQVDFSNATSDSSIDEALFADSLGISAVGLTGANADLAMAKDSSLLVQSLDNTNDSASDSLESNIAEISIQNQEGPQKSSADLESNIQNEISKAANKDLMLPDLSFEMESGQDSSIVGNSDKVSENPESLADANPQEDTSYMARIAQISPTAYRHLLTLEDKQLSPETV